MHINTYPTSILAITVTPSVNTQKAIASHLFMKKHVFLRSLPVLNSNIKKTIEERPPSTGENNRVESAYDCIFKPVFINLLMNMNFFPFDNNLFEAYMVCLWG